MEVMVALVLASIMLTLGFSGLNKARVSGGSRGLATAVAGELRLAREKAIAKGSPVAVVFPNGVGRSLFFLEGDTEPVVTRAVNYAGDYPYGTITVATYPGPSFSQNLSMPGSKAQKWEESMDTWLPADFKNHFVFMFIPNGSVVTNDLPAADGSYRVICSTGADVSAASAPGGTGHVSGNDLVYFSLDAAGEPQTVAISASGAVEATPMLLGSSGGVNTAGGGNPTVANPPAPEVDYEPEVPDLFHHRVTPPKELVDDEWVHVIDTGEYLTLEVFAHSEDGKPLYSGWEDDPVTKDHNPDFKGRFSVPGGQLERMEFYPEYDVYEDGRPPVKDVWRSVWTWTPPKTAEPGDRYNLEVDVRDAKKEVSAVLPSEIPVDVAPPGEIVFERQETLGGRWHLYTMWADGSRITPITEGDHDYRYASATADGEMIAFEMDGNEVWVMQADGTGKTRVGWGSCPTISPTGDSIAFIRGSNVCVKRLEGASPEMQVATVVTNVAGVPDRGSRIAYRPDGRRIYYTDPGGGQIRWTNLGFTGISAIEVGASGSSNPVGNIAPGHTPEVGGLFAGRHGQVYYHADSADPYIGQFVSNGNGDLMTVDHRVSVGQKEVFPAISPNEDLLLFCEGSGVGDFQIKAVPIGDWNDPGAGETLTGNSGNNLRPAWIRQRHPF